MDVGMERKEWLTPWIVPRWGVRDFYAQIEAVADFGYRVTGFYEHDLQNYLVLTAGFDAGIHTELTDFLKKLWD